MYYLTIYQRFDSLNKTIFIKTVQAQFDYKQIQLKFTKSAKILVPYRTPYNFLSLSFSLIFSFLYVLIH